MNNLSVTPYSVEQAISLGKLDKVKYIIIGSNKFGLRQVAEFSLEDIKQVVKAKDNNKICVAVNKIMHKNDIDELRSYLKKLNEIGVDYLIFSDFAVLMVVQELKLNMQLIYNTETTITNSYFTTLAKEQGIAVCELAKEITLKEILEIANLKESMISVNIHGHIYMYQSIRKLITNYEEHQNIDIDRDKKLYLHDSERDIMYPVIENDQGTHILAGNDLCMINKLNKMVNKGIDIMKIDGLLYEPNNYLDIVSMYNEVIIQLENDINTDIKDYLNEIKKIDSSKKYNTGFYFKETIY